MLNRGPTYRGTAVHMPKDENRRMTLHGPGTAGYIAPDTRNNTYDYQADMWAYLAGSYNRSVFSST